VDVAVAFDNLFGGGARFRHGSSEAIWCGVTVKVGVYGAHNPYVTEDGILCVRGKERWLGREREGRRGGEREAGEKPLLSVSFLSNHAECYERYNTLACARSIL